MTIIQESLFVSESNLAYNSDLFHLVQNIVGTTKNPEAIDSFLRNMTLQGVFQASVDDLKEHGFTPAQAKRLHASIRFNERLNLLKPADRITIRSPKDIADYVMEELKYLQQEHFVVLYLNTKNQVILKKTLFVGSLAISVVHPRDVIREGVKISAASCIAIHNHPSGIPTPSTPDIEVTKRLKDCLEIMGMDLLDHVIIGMDQYISLKEKGYME